MDVRLVSPIRTEVLRPFSGRLDKAEARLEAGVEISVRAAGPNEEDEELAETKGLDCSVTNDRQQYTIRPAPSQMFNLPPSAAAS